MQFDWNICPPAERCTLRLRALYEQAGYRRFRCARFKAGSQPAHELDVGVSDNVVIAALFFEQGQRLCQRLCQKVALRGADLTKPHGNMA